MNLHVKFVILVVGIVALAGLVMLLRADAVMRRDSTLTFDAFLVLLGVGLIGVVVSYVRARRGGGAPAAEGHVTEAGPRRAPVIERLLGKKRSRILNLIVLVAVSVVVLFLVVLLAYMLYFHLLA